MTTSTPPAWKWRGECEVPVTTYNVTEGRTVKVDGGTVVREPVTTDPGPYPADVSEMCRNYTEAELSIYSRKLPDSDALCERNGSGTEPEASCFTTRKLEPEDSTPESAWAYMASQVGAIRCDSPAQNYNEHINAAPEHVESCVSEGSREHRIGTCYLDPDTGETVMPADFFGEKELRWTIGEDGKRHVGNVVCTVIAPETTSPADSCAPKCPVCLREMENDEGVLCDHCGEPTGPGSFAVVNGPGVVAVYHLPCYDEVYWGGEGDGLPAFHGGGQIPERETDAVEETFSVPFPVQSWTFGALIELEVDHLHEIIDDHHDEIVERARKRHREGFVAYGSKGYSWDPKTRLRNVLEELSDGGTYLTMGPIE